MEEHWEEDANLQQADMQPGEEREEGVRWGFWWKVLLTVALVLSSLITLYGEEMVDLAADLGLVPDVEAVAVRTLAARVAAMLTRLIRRLR